MVVKKRESGHGPRAHNCHAPLPLAAGSSRPAVMPTPPPLRPCPALAPAWPQGSERRQALMAGEREDLRRRSKAPIREGA